MGGRHDAPGGLRYQRAQLTVQSKAKNVISSRRSDHLDYAACDWKTVGCGAEIDVEIFQLSGPTGGYRRLDACPCGPTGPRVLEVGCGDQAEDVERSVGLDTAEGRAAGDVPQRMSQQVTEPATHRGQPTEPLLDRQS